ncbi:uncharacterized protein CELE_Y43F8B.22 [Caenorhabditis elegans]|uniref:Uncharacterized protein n=1 Tax=Caenorhabditis elegans TaxID=6239 RepID=C6S3M2_CAEEL|nr:Uncharacterized protein CELE_Y43F8B.22 [Caenorhabditis elegans]CBA11617.1 Uncharacterized protein CELE_Y43F8B.22 [Caenorhabditis elegans]|eukprot:NP_001256867.1 Uncharacterized protein CELE_Y43F8B.22 [Caenorhabditis elegans]
MQFNNILKNDINFASGKSTDFLCKYLSTGKGLPQILIRRRLRTSPQGLK